MTKHVELFTNVNGKVVILA